MRSGMFPIEVDEMGIEHECREPEECRLCGRPGEVEVG